MKSKVIENRHIVECNCGDPTQLLVFDYYDDLTDMEIYLTSNWRGTLFNRIKQAIQFIFKSRKYMIMDSVLVSEKNIADLEEIISIIKTGVQE